MMKNFKLKHYINYIVVAALGILFTVMSLTDSFASPLALIQLEKIVIAVLLAVSLSVVVGFLGESAHFRGVGHQNNGDAFLRI